MYSDGIGPARRASRSHMIAVMGDFARKLKRRLAGSNDWYELPECAARGSCWTAQTTSTITSSTIRAARTGRRPCAAASPARERGRSGGGTRAWRASGRRCAGRSWTGSVRFAVTTSSTETDRRALRVVRDHCAKRPLGTSVLARGLTWETNWTMRFERPQRMTRP
jgi:hypothetical protein